MKLPLAFDTHAYVKKLTAAGMPERQAEVQAEALTEFAFGVLATKDDLQSVKQELQNVKQDLHQALQNLKQEVESVRQEVKSLRQDVKLEMEATASRLEAMLHREINLQSWRLFGLMVAMVGIALTVAKFWLVK